MSDRQRALRALLDRCEYVRANVVQPANQGRTKPTEWQPFLWVDWAHLRARDRAGA